MRMRPTAVQARIGVVEWGSAAAMAAMRVVPVAPKVSAMP
jgi:hypothetical protein